MEQLHSSTVIAAGAVTSKRTRPQWQPPACTTIVGDALESLRRGRARRFERDPAALPVNRHLEVIEEVAAKYAVNIGRMWQCLEHPHVNAFDGRGANAHRPHPDERDRDTLAADHCAEDLGGSG